MMGIILIAIHGIVVALVMEESLSDRILNANHGKPVFHQEN